ncbi:MAG: hypothetical protein P8Y14_12600 [Anaerolineales bacterium]
MTLRKAPWNQHDVTGERGGENRQRQRCAQIPPHASQAQPGDALGANLRRLLI